MYLFSAFEQLGMMMIMKLCNMPTTKLNHYCDVIMGAMASQVTILTSVYWTVYSAVDQRKHQSSASLAFVRVIDQWPVNYPHRWPVTRKMFPFDDVTMCWRIILPSTNIIDCKAPIKTKPWISLDPHKHRESMMTSSNGNLFLVTGPLCGEFTGYQWIPLTQDGDAELWCFRWSGLE